MAKLVRSGQTRRAAVVCVPGGPLMAQGVFVIAVSV